MGRYRIKERVRCLANFMLIRFCSVSECISAWTEWEAGFKQRVTCSNKPSLDMVEEPPTHIPNITSVCTLVTVSDTQLENGPRSHNENSPKMSLLVLRIESGPPNLHELAWRVKRRLKDSSSRSYQQRWMLLKRNRQQSIQEREEDNSAVICRWVADRKARRWEVPWAFREGRARRVFSDELCKKSSIH